GVADKFNSPRRWIDREALSCARHRTCCAFLLRLTLCLFGRVFLPTKGKRPPSILAKIPRFAVLPVPLNRANQCPSVDVVQSRKFFRQTLDAPLETLRGKLTIKLALKPLLSDLFQSLCILKARTN